MQGTYYVISWYEYLKKIQEIWNQRQRIMGGNITILRTKNNIYY